MKNILWSVIKMKRDSGNKCAFQNKNRTLMSMEKKTWYGFENDSPIYNTGRILSLFGYSI